MNLTIMGNAPIYTLRRQEVFASLETFTDGLPAEEAASRLEHYGPNLLADPPERPVWRTMAGFLIHPMALLLWAAGAAACLAGRVEVGVVIWGVVLANGAFSFWREYRAERAVSQLKKLLPTYARVIRAGQEVRLPASEIVPGDILTLAEGDNIPADARLVEASGLRTNNATLTGEALPALRTSDASARQDLSEIEQPNLVFAGTSVFAGTGKAVVYATGMLTQFGRIANLTQAEKEEPSLIQAQMGQISRRISLVAVILGILVFAIAITDVGIPHREAFILAVGILVASIPEGLVPTVTLVLAMAVQRLAQQNVLVKKLSAVETLGSVSVICTDKSGTLTQNQMTVRKVWVNGRIVDVSGVGYTPQGKFTPHLSAGGDMDYLCRAALLCNNARLVPPDAGRPNWSSLGDQTEAALRVLALKWGLEETATQQAYPRLHELPFDARRKRMSTIHRGPEGSFAYVKGAPREVLLLCTHIRLGGEIIPLEPALRAELLTRNDEMARSALRVLALAERRLPPRSGMYTPESIETGLTFLGLVGMMDPPRPEVAQAIQSFHTAGIRLVMVTGDYGLTAESLARRVGMLSSPTPRIVTGADLDAMNDDALYTLLDQEVIYSRMAPDHKLRLVDAFKARGEVVAVIGDGVNDIPALQKADVGIAVGMSGKDVAKEAADVILVDDNFYGVVNAIAEGRTVFKNLRKFITYIFASNIPEILPFILTALFNLPLALTVPQILLIDLGTDLIPAFALGVEKPESDVMHQPPRRRAQPIIDASLLRRAFLWLGAIEAALCYLAFFGVLTANGLPLSSLITFDQATFKFPQGVYLTAITVFNIGVVMAQVGNLFACQSENGHARGPRRWNNKYIWIGITVEVAMIAATVYLPPLARAFNHIPIPPVYWLGLAGFAPILYLLEKGRKIFLHYACSVLRPRRHIEQTLL